MLSNNSRKVCVIGAGYWGRNHIKTLDSLHCLGGVVENDKKIVDELKEVYPQIPFYERYEEAVQKDFDGYTIATPAETHYEIAQYLLKQKKHVLVEKPLALNSDEAYELNSLAIQNRVNLMVGHLLLFHPAIRKIKELIENGKIGKVQYLYSNRLNLGTIRKEENILWSFAPHDISIFQFLLKNRPIEIISRGGAFIQPNIDDSTLTIFRYPQNIVAHIFVSWLHPFKEHRLVVIGSRGMLSFEDSSREKQILFYEKGIDWVKGEPVRRDGPTEVIPYDPAMPLMEELRYFIKHLNGDTVKISDGQNGIDVLEILEEATHSLLRGSEVIIDRRSSDKKPKEYFIHSTAILDDHVKIGEGTKIWQFSHIQSNAEIGENCVLGQNVYVGNNVKIGKNCKIQNNASIYEGVILEDFVFCGPSMVFTNIKDPRCEFPQKGKGSYKNTLIKYGASIGANSTIVCGNTIGRFAFIAAGAVITKDVSDYALMAGVPAKRVDWVSRHGAKLLEKNSEGIRICSKSGWRYKEIEPEVLRCLDWKENDNINQTDL